MIQLDHTEPPVDPGPRPDPHPTHPPPIPPAPAPDVVPVRDPEGPDHPEPVKEPPSHEPPVSTR